MHEHDVHFAGAAYRQLQEQERARRVVKAARRQALVERPVPTPRRPTMVSERELFELELVEHPVRSRIGWGIGFLIGGIIWIMVIGGLLYAVTK